MRFERVEAPLPEELLVTGSRDRELELVVDLIVTLSGRGRRDAQTRSPSEGVRSEPGRSSGGAAAVRASSGTTSSSFASVPEDREEHVVERRDLRLIGDEHGTRRPVQPPACDRTDERERPREADRASRRDRHAGVVQTPAQGSDERRQVELDRLDPERGEIRQSPVRTSSSRPAARITS